MKQFRINEQEKSRILGLHVEATSRQYLKEDLNNGMTQKEIIEKYGVDESRVYKITRELEWVEGTVKILPERLSNNKRLLNHEERCFIYTLFKTMLIDIELVANHFNVSKSAIYSIIHKTYSDNKNIQIVSSDIFLKYYKELISDNYIIKL